MYYCRAINEQNGTGAEEGKKREKVGWLKTWLYDNTGQPLLQIHILLNYNSCIVCYFSIVYFKRA
jgi:hypothetical protein